jgi:hypothetical protein
MLKYINPQKIYITLVCLFFIPGIFWFIYPLVFKDNPSAMFYYYYYSFLYPIDGGETSYNFASAIAESKKIAGDRSDLDYSIIFQCIKQTKPNSKSLELRDIYSYKLPTHNYAVSVIVISDEGEHQYTSLTSFIAEIDKKSHTCKSIKQHGASMG